jgi:hypothetical protein
LVKSLKTVEFQNSRFNYKRRSKNRPCDAAEAA